MENNETRFKKLSESLANSIVQKVSTKGYCIYYLCPLDLLFLQSIDGDVFGYIKDMLKKKDIDTIVIYNYAYLYLPANLSPLKRKKLIESYKQSAPQAYLIQVNKSLKKYLTILDRLSPHELIAMEEFLKSLDDMME